MNKELEKLLTNKKEEEEKLRIADEENNFLLCIIIGNTLNEIDKRIREIATEKEYEELHIKGLV